MCLFSAKGNTYNLLPTKAKNVNNRTTSRQSWRTFVICLSGCLIVINLSSSDHYFRPNLIFKINYCLSLRNWSVSCQHSQRIQYYPFVYYFWVNPTQLHTFAVAQHFHQMAQKTVYSTTNSCADHADTTLVGNLRAIKRRMGELALNRYISSKRKGEAFYAVCL